MSAWVPGGPGRRLVFLRAAADLTALLPGTLRARVTEDGRTLPNTMLALERNPDSTLGDPSRQTQMVKTDDDGCFQFTARPGRYRLRRGNDKAWAATPTIELLRDAILEQTFEFAAGTLQVRLLTADGRPAKDVGLHTATQGNVPVRTNADGSATALLPPGEHTLRVLAHRLQQREAELGPRLLSGHERPAAGDWFDLGNATIIAGRTTTLELRLPADWEKR